MTTFKPLDAGLLKRGPRGRVGEAAAVRKTHRKVGVRLDVERYAAFKAFCARSGLTGEQALVRALDHLLADGRTDP
jgi:hypothetical protein